MDGPAFRATMQKPDQKLCHPDSQDYLACVMRGIAAQKRAIEEFGLEAE
jgi:hypothetical protein